MADTEAPPQSWKPHGKARKGQQRSPVQRPQNPDTVIKRDPPCSHNEWLCMDRRPTYVRLKCMVCSTKWRTVLSWFGKCPEFHSEARMCSQGAACSYPHVYARSRRHEAPSQRALALEKEGLADAVSSESSARSLALEPSLVDAASCSAGMCTALDCDLHLGEGDVDATLPPALLLEGEGKGAFAEGEDVNALPRSEIGPALSAASPRHQVETIVALSAFATLWEGGRAARLRSAHHGSGSSADSSDGLSRSLPEDDEDDGDVGLSTAEMKALSAYALTP
eukprot:TRINITY_DN2053_c0_g2_i1.p1 TRINITY_DN2053_c0_g2~~TRINITY_DN2053_c0_g2_i1.p1  ORF type:complete len:280 (+),score=71.32 TRINITY_DN2053_c0_g2_i1:86-925(+)